MNDAQAFWVLGDRYTFLHSGESISVLEIESAIQHGPPPHVHQNEDETLYVIDGEIKVWKAGGGPYIPRMRLSRQLLYRHDS